ncbi:MAG: DNA-binding protein [Candidatus Hecatellales archaeon ex4484_218]|nr:MAG: DNA-binding protein [Candidatus Hecatellales archaeon ex4484_218]
MGKIEELRLLKERSKRFFETAKLQIKHQFYDLAIFSLEQALQLFLKTKLLDFGVDYPKTHSVRKLLEIIFEVTPKNYKVKVKEVLDKYLLELGILEDAYITSRYVVREYRKEEAEKLLKVVEDVIKKLT